jgi:spore maturation protein CgeB
MYPGYLKYFYEKYPDIRNLSYDEHCNLLLNDTTEFVGSYTKNFRKLGIEANCLIANDISLQNKWRLENILNNRSIDDVLYHQVNSYSPDILWIENLNGIDCEWLNNIRERIKNIRLIVAYHCSPYNQNLLRKLKCVDFVITCTPGLKVALEKEGLRSYLVYHGFDHDLLPRLNDTSNEVKKDLIFSGSLTTGGDLHNKRIALIEHLLSEKIKIDLHANVEKAYRIRIKQSIYFLTNLLKKLNLEKLTDGLQFFEYGKSPVRSYSKTLLNSISKPAFGINMYNLFNMSKIVLNNHIGVAGDFAGNMRLFEVTGIGSCLLTDNKKNMSDLFDTTNEVVVYDNPEDCIRKVKWLLENEEERKRIALNGHKKTIESHTVEKRAKTIIEIIKSELNRL